jgi:hypothetical protein
MRHFVLKFHSHLAPFIWLFLLYFWWSAKRNKKIPFIKKLLQISQPTAQSAALPVGLPAALPAALPAGLPAGQSDRLPPYQSPYQLAAQPAACPPASLPTYHPTKARFKHSKGRPDTSVGPNGRLVGDCSVINRAVMGTGISKRWGWGWG